MEKRYDHSVRTLQQAYAFVLRVRICGIFSDAKSGLVSSCLSGCFSTTQYVGMGSWLNGLEGLCRPVSADMRSAYARFRDRAGSGMRPLVACADCAERQIHQDKPEADRGSRRDRFQSAIAADSQWRGPPKAAPTSRLCADRFAGAEDEAHAEIRLAATPQSS